MDETLTRDWRDRTESRIGALEAEVKHGHAARQELRDEVKDIAGEVRQINRDVNQTVMTLRAEWEKENGKVLSTIGARLDAYERAREAAESAALTDIRRLLEEQTQRPPPALAPAPTEPPRLPLRLIIIAACIAGGLVLGMGIMIGLLLQLADLVEVARGAATP